MARLFGWVDDRFRAPAPAERIAVLRILVGAFALVYLVARAKSLVSPVGFAAAQFEPIGVVKLLSQPAAPAAVYASVGAAILAGAAFVAGFRYRVTAPAFAFLLLWVLTYRSSWGMIFHTENHVVVQVLVLSLAPAADALSYDARHRKKAPKDAARYGWPIRLICLITTVAYMLAGVAKLAHSGLGWMTSDILRNYIAYDNVRKALLGDGFSPIGAWLVRYAWLFKPLAVWTIVIELFAPLVLFSRRLSRLWVLNIWAFHIGVLLTMWIFFPYQVLGIGFASFFPVERVAQFVRRRWRHRKAAEAAAT